MVRMSAEKSNLVEVAESQLDAVRLLIERIDEKTSSELVEMVLRVGSIFVTGQGRSGLVAQCLATRLAQMGLNVYIPGHAICRKIEKGDLLIAISCRGTTRTTVEFVRIAKDVGAEVAAVTAFNNSTLTELADHVVLIPSNDADVRAQCRDIVGPENNTLFEETSLLYFDALVVILLGRKGISKSIISQRHTNLE
jgi:6-phospho-3-hexuloisomerase